MATHHGALKKTPEGLSPTDGETVGLSPTRASRDRAHRVRRERPRLVDIDSGGTLQVHRAGDFLGAPWRICFVGIQID